MHEAKGGPRILVVDDDASIRLLLSTMLSQNGFRVAEATDGPEALEILRGDDPFDLVTLDLRMEEMHGLEVLQQIRSRLATADLPVIVATASGDPAVEMQLFEAGADDFVVQARRSATFLAADSSGAAAAESQPPGRPPLACLGVRTPRPAGVY